MFYTQKELANLLRVTEATITRWRQKGRLVYVRLPDADRVLYPKEEIDKLLKDNRRKDSPTKETIQ
jgi:excisionase family DNA binding protein